MPLFRKKKTAQKDAEKKPYAFTTDWFCGNEKRFRRFLAPLIGTPCSILEIGAFEGRSSCWLLDNIATHPKSRVVSIDLAPQPALLGNIALSDNASKHRLRAGRSIDVVPTLKDGRFDFIYIDGCHTSFHVLADAVTCFQKSKVGGIMAFDDYEWNDPGIDDGTSPKPAIDLFLAAYRKKLSILEKGYQVWVRKTAH